MDTSLAYTFAFQRINRQWYVHLPSYTAQQGLNEAWLPIYNKGMDTYLDDVAERENGVELEIRTEPFAGADELMLLHVLPKGTGAYYLLKTLEGQPYVLQLMMPERLCYYMGFFPQNMYWEAKHPSASKLL